MIIFIIIEFYGLVDQRILIKVMDMQMQAI